MYKTSNSLLHYFKGIVHLQLLASVFFLYSICGYSQLKSETKTVLYQVEFDKALDSTNWEVEMDPGDDAKVFSKNKKLTIDSPYGVTVWFKKQLDGNIIIEYDWKVILEGGKNDRLSDLNQFWMATDPHNKNLFTRQGKFADYDSLSLYYV